MILPYVYMLINKETDQFYYGYRYKNVSLGRKSEDDLGVVYFTSSNYINKTNFLTFTIIIIAEFFNKNDAYWFEQQLIKDNKNNPLLLNRHYQDPFNGSKEFVNFGHTDESKTKMAGKKRSIEFREYRREIMTGNIPWNKGLTKVTDSRMLALSHNRAKTGNAHQIGMKYSQDRINKVRQKLIGRKVPEDQVQKMSDAKKGKSWVEIYTPEEVIRKRNKIKERTGANHPNAKSIHTPAGIFNSLIEATEYFKVSETTIRSRCLNTKDVWKEWFYMSRDITVS